MSRPIITLTTDFGSDSPYVAQMKGVILSICRDVDLVDISHAIGPQNIREGAVVLADATPRFPPATLHVAVVDPGVGTTRRVVYVELGQQRYIAPDNGLLSLLAKHEPPRVVAAIENDAYWLAEPSQTFHGRDIMAPVAAHLASGLDPAKLGPRLGALVMLPWQEPHKSSSQITGEVLFIDSFGNVITNIGRADVTPLAEPAALVVDCGGHQIRGLVPTYGAALAGEIIALFDSQGRLEIAKVGGHAARDLNLEAGEAVIISA
jgi:S-adenosyl-L-methionine hydrolase (adenosine-forming)